MPRDDKDTIKLLARAVLELSKKAAHEWDFDGEQSVSTGIELEDQRAIEELANG